MSEEGKCLTLVKDFNLKSDTAKKKKKNLYLDPQLGYHLARAPEYSWG